MIRVAKHSSRNINNSTFSCNLWWFVGVCNIAVEAFWLAAGRVWCVFSLSFFCLLVSDKFGKKYILFSILGTGQTLLGAWGGHFFFIALKHGANTFFCSLQPWVGYFFPLPWSQRENIYRTKCSCSYIFHWNSRQWLKYSCTYRSEQKKNSDTARSQYSEYYES